MEDAIKKTRIISITLAIWGVIFLITGGILSTIDRTIVKTEYSVNVDNQKVSDLRTKEIKLKDMELEENNPLSVDPADYIVDSDQISENILKALKLDTSMVNINEPGEYKYTIRYKKKVYTGKFTITEKKLPTVTLTLKEINLNVGDAISRNASSYINETLPEEVYNNLTLDLSKVSTAKAGVYEYYIYYNNETYQNKIIVTETQTGPKVITPTEEAETNTDNPTDNSNNN